MLPQRTRLHLFSNCNHAPKKSDIQTQFNNERGKRILGAPTICVATVSILAAVFGTELPVCPPNLTGTGKPVVNLGNLRKYNNTRI